MSSPWRVAGIDLGGTQVRMAFAGDDGVIVASCRADTRSLRTPEAVVGWAAEQARGHGAALAGVAIGAPGLIDAGRRVLLDPPNLEGWRDVPLAAMLEDAVGCPAHLENDANLAGLAEFAHGAGRGSRNLVYMTWSTGIGGGVVLDGKLFVGSHGQAGEIGHMIVEPDGPPCTCGQRGCLEAVCGGASLARRTGAPADELFRNAAAGDASALETMRHVCTTMGRALVTLTHAFDPDAIVVGGGFVGSWHLLGPAVGEVLNASPFIKPERRPALRPAALGTDAGQQGAVEWARIHARSAPDS